MATTTPATHHHTMGSCLIPCDAALISYIYPEKVYRLLVLVAASWNRRTEKGKQHPRKALFVSLKGNIYVAAESFITSIVI